MLITPEIAYFIKINLAFVLLYGLYRVFFYKDTYFTLRRITLLLFYLLAFSYPLFNIQDWIKTQQQPIAEVIYYMLADVIVEENTDFRPVSWQEIITYIVYASYLLTAGVLFLRFLIQLVSIYRIKKASRKSIINGIPVYLLPKSATPFSFFGSIFVYPPNHSEKELEEILLHEQTHATQWHSIDVILSELTTIVCWVNPFAWLLKREVRYNLEYLADNSVIHSGYDSKTYQFHLLGLAYNQSTATLYNSFNLLDIKNRIIMMNKKRSTKIGRAKYFVLLPLAVFTLQFCNLEKEKQSTETVAETAPEVTVEPAQQETTPETVQHTGQVFTIVEEMPKFPGGEAALLKFINENVKYPVEAQEKGIQGRVIASFVVNTDGSISDAEVMRGIDESLDKESLRVINSFPNWTPGKQRGESVRVKYTVPITFRLQ